MCVASSTSLPTLSKIKHLIFFQYHKCKYFTGVFIFSSPISRNPRRISCLLSQKYFQLYKLLIVLFPIFLLNSLDEFGEVLSLMPSSSLWLFLSLCLYFQLPCFECFKGDHSFPFKFVTFLPYADMVKLLFFLFFLKYFQSKSLNHVLNIQ